MYMIYFSLQAYTDVGSCDEANRSCDQVNRPCDEVNRPCDEVNRS